MTIQKNTKILIVFMAFMLVVILVLIYEKTSDNFSFVNLANQVIPSLIATTLSFLTLYFIFERNGISFEGSQSVAESTSKSDRGSFSSIEKSIGELLIRMEECQAGNKSQDSFLPLNFNDIVSEIALDQKSQLELLQVILGGNIGSVGNNYTVSNPHVFLDVYYAVVTCIEKKKLTLESMVQKNNLEFVFQYVWNEVDGQAKFLSENECQETVLICLKILRMEHENE